MLVISRNTLKTFLLSALLLLPANPSVFAAVSVVQHKVNFSGSGASSISTTVTATGSGNLLIAGTISAHSHFPVISVSDGTNNFIKFPEATGIDILNDAQAEIWYLPQSTSGKTLITLTIGSTSTFIGLEVWEVSGFTNPVPDATGTVNDGVQTGGTATGSAVRTRSSKGFIVGMDITEQAVSSNPAAGNEFTSGGDIDAGGDAFCSLISTTAATHQPSWTDNGNTFTSITAAFKEFDTSSSTFGGSSTFRGNTTIK